MRLRSDAQIKHWFEKKSGGESNIVSFKSDLLTDCRHILLVLPTDLTKLFIYLPFIVSLVSKKKGGEFLILAEEDFRQTLRWLSLENYAAFYEKEKMLYGEDDFFALEQTIKKHIWDLCLFLQDEKLLPFLYFARISNAKYRIGFQQEFPFLNIALKAGRDSDYANRNFLYKTFQLEPQELPKKNAKIEKKGEYSRLTSSNTFLLNMEPPSEGNIWSEDELDLLCKALSPKYRLIAIAANQDQLKPYYDIFERLEIRTHPVFLNSESIFSVLGQYPLIITLSSPYVHLFLNLSEIKTILIESDLTTDIPKNPRFLRFRRDESFRSLVNSIAEFIK